MKLSYQRKIPSLSVVSAYVGSISGNTITLSNVTSGMLSYLNESSYVSIGSVSGVSVISETLNTSLPYQPLTITVSSVVGINVGDPILVGNYVVNVSQLPDECEKYLISALERMIQYRQSSIDFQVSNLLTSEELSLIKEVFADNSYDDAKPPVTEWSEWLP
jgi:hypothetical protein